MSTTSNARRSENAARREALNRKADRLIAHLTKNPHDDQARADLLDTWEELGVGVIRVGSQRRGSPRVD